MQLAQAFAGIGLIFVVLLDAFQTVVLPRRAAQRLRPTSARSPDTS